MSILILPADVLLITDKLAYVYRRMLYSLGAGSFDSYVVGTDQYLLRRLLEDLVDIDSYTQQHDLSDSAYGGLLRHDRNSLAAITMSPVVRALESHVEEHGSLADGDVDDLASYLEFYNATPFSYLVHAEFAELYFALFGSRLPPAGVQSVWLRPVANVSAPLGMGQRNVGGAFSAGAVVDTSLYSEVIPDLEVRSDFADGTAPPTFAVAGVDHTGVSTTTWTATGGSDNPASGVATTITPAVTAMARQTVAVGSVAGIVVGSFLTVNSGLSDQEYVNVEAVVGSTITAVFDLAHPAGATVTAKTTLNLTPSVAGRRIRSVSNITIGITDHTTGTVMVVGRLDRQHDPS